VLEKEFLVLRFAYFCANAKSECKKRLWNVNENAFEYWQMETEGKQMIFHGRKVMNYKNELIWYFDILISGNAIFLDESFQTSKV
jgi:hypothetical protein